MIAALQDIGPHRLHFKFEPNSKCKECHHVMVTKEANLQPADLLASKKPVIIGAPLLHDSASSKAKRIFYNGKVDYEGPVHLVNPAMTRIKRQIGGGKATNKMMAQDSDDDDLSSLSPSPAPAAQCSKSQKAMSKSVDNIVKGRDPSLPKGIPKVMRGRKKVEVVLTTAARNTSKRAPSVIVVRDSSASEGTNVSSELMVVDDSAEPFVCEDKQDPPIHKRKAKSQQSSRPAKRVVSSLDTMQPSNLKAVKPSLQARSVKKKRLRVISPPNFESSDEEGSPPEDRKSRSTVQDVRPGTQRNAQTTRGPIEHPLPTKELCDERCKSSFTCMFYSTT